MLSHTHTHMHTHTRTHPLPLKCFYFFVCALYVIMYHALIYVFALSQTGLTAPNRQECSVDTYSNAVTSGDINS